MANVSLLFREYMHLDRRRGGAGLTPIELKRWGDLKRMLSKRFSPDLSDEEADKRTSLRIPTRLTVKLPEPGRLPLQHDDEPFSRRAAGDVLEYSIVNGDGSPS